MCARGRQKAHKKPVQENVYRIRTENWRGMRLFLCFQPDVLRDGRAYHFRTSGCRRSYNRVHCTRKPAGSLFLVIF